MARGIAIRSFREADLVPVGRLIHRTIEICYSGVYPPRAVRFFKEFHSGEKILERRRKGEILVVEKEGRVIATGSVVAGEIFGVFVHPGFQKHGYGRLLMDRLEDRLRAGGRPSAELSVSLPSRRFYENRGYELLEECSIDVGEGQRLDFWKAAKKLAGGED